MGTHTASYRRTNHSTALEQVTVPASAEALERLASVSSLTEVAAEFGSARRLATLVLGRPGEGGHATRPVVRSLGRLLQHGLGPSVAAEALTLAHLAADSVDTTTIELLLDRAFEATCSLRPFDLSLRTQVEELLACGRTPAQRRRLVLGLWRPDGPVRLPLWIEGLTPDFDVTWTGLDGSLFRCGTRLPTGWVLRDDGDELHGAVRSPGEIGGFAVEVEDWVLDAGRLAQMTPAERRDAVSRLSAVELQRLANRDGIEEFDDLFEVLLLEATSAVLHFRSRSDDLVSRVLLPCDPASALLAVLAGPSYVDQTRLRRWLRNARRGDLEWIAERAPVHLPAALNWLGLLDAGWFTTGPLRSANLHDPWIIRAAFHRNLPGGRGHEHPLLAELQARPDVDVDPGAARWCEPYTPDQDPALALVLARTATGGLRRWTGPLYERVDRDRWHRQLVDHRELAAVDALPATMRTTVPDVPASRRPPRPHRAVRETLEPALHGGPFRYAPEIAVLDGAPLPERPEWTVRLPVDVAALERNARVMGNCTATLLDSIVSGGSALLILEGPLGELLNAEVRLEHWDGHSPESWGVGQINSVRNAGDPYDWTRPTLERLVADATADHVT